MSPPFRTARRVEFRDTDAAGIAHFSTYIHFMEAAEHEMLRALGTSVVSNDGDSEISWPRVAVSCDYQQAAKFEDEIDIEVSVARLGTKSVTYQFAMSHDGDPLAHGTMTAVCCRISHDAPPQSIEIPAEIRAKLATMQTVDEG